jgi:serine/threonine protein kinase
LADDLNLGRPVALKTLRPRGSSTTGEQALKGLRHEARLLAALDHPHVVRVYAWRQAGDDQYLVLQYVAGGSLEDRLRRDGPIAWHIAARYIADVGDGLLAAHAQGVVHRDVKPANILWDSTADEALLTDFGIAARLADPGAAAGSPLYMAPEAFEGKVAPALDVYSLAPTFFRLVTGTAPFPAESVEALPPRCTDMGPWYSALAAACCTMATQPKMSFRPRSSCWRAEPSQFASTCRSAVGYTGSRTGSP